MMMNRLMKYASNGAVSYGALAYFSGGASTVRVMDYDLPLPLFALGLGVGSAIAADFANNLVLPYLPQDQKLKSLESTAVNLGSGAGAALLFCYVANKDLLANPGTMQIAMTGVAIEVGGEWVYQQLAKFMGVNTDRC